MPVDARRAEVGLPNSNVYVGREENTSIHSSFPPTGRSSPFGSVAVAEGIESMADLQALQVMRCDYGQGILLAPPMPKGRFIELLNSRNNKSAAAAPPPAMQRDRVA